MARGKVKELDLIFHYHRMAERLDEKLDFIQQFVKRFALAGYWHGGLLALATGSGVRQLAAAFLLRACSQLTVHVALHS